MIDRDERMLASLRRIAELAVRIAENLMEEGKQIRDLVAERETRYSFLGTVDDSGGGQVTVAIDPDTPRYPIEGTRVLVTVLADETKS